MGHGMTPRWALVQCTEVMRDLVMVRGKSSRQRPERLGSQGAIHQVVIPNTEGSRCGEIENKMTGKFRGEDVSHVW